MRHGTDWLEVVYGAGLDVGRGGAGGARAEIRVRESPALAALEPGQEHRIRVTVAPSDPGLTWRLYLRDFGPGPGQVRGDRVWWRIDPGTWQPLGGTRQCVAEGRGRVRVDLSVRVERSESGVAPRLRFVAEST
ncbi:MAG: hypothetical protein R6U63_09260 [Longimicrobiales bacterium]